MKNIIHFFAESWDGRMLGSMGHPALQDATPNIDRLAAAGAQFDRAYTTHPICCPARANLWSGRYTHNCESWNNFKGLEPKMWSLLDHLKATHTVHNLGKLDYRSGAHTIQARLTAWLGAAGIDKPEYDEDPTQCFSVDEDDNPRCHEKDWRMLDQAIAFLDEQAAEQKAGGKPFFLTFSTGLVHAAFRTNRHWLERIPEELVDIPPIDNTTHPCRLFQRMAKAWRYGFDDATVRKVRRIYFAMCAEADALVGALYEAMHRLGLADNTYFVFNSDHGEMGLEHQEWYKTSFYEGSVRIPMIMSGPGIAAGQRYRNLVSLTDLCPTFQEMAGIPVSAGLDGESLLPLATGLTTQSRNRAYACLMGTTMNTSGYMLRRDRWKYVAFVGHPAQLFDIEADPGELHDLAPENPALIQQLDTELREIVDYEQTHHDVMAYNKEAFRQWRRQAKRGLYVDASYGLGGQPSSDYWKIMNNAFTGYNEGDEKKVEQWLNS